MPSKHIYLSAKAEAILQAIKRRGQESMSAFVSRAIIELAQRESK